MNMMDFQDYTPPPKPRRFEPYADNGGSVVAIAGADYAVIGSDTRLSGGFTIHTREQNKLFELSPRTVLGVAGCWCDTLTLTRNLYARKRVYEQDHNKPMATPAIAQMLSIMLYYKRFFPYYVTNIMAGLDQTGRGCVYSYDPVGHSERSMFHAGGSAGSQLQPLLDNQIGLENMQGVTKEEKNECLPMKHALALLKDAFISAAERDVNTGDSINIAVMTRNGIRYDQFKLRND